jgi:hypothetical protein
MGHSKWGEKEEKGEGSESPGAKEEGKKNTNIVHRVGAELELSRNVFHLTQLQDVHRDEDLGLQTAEG